MKTKLMACLVGTMVLTCALRATAQYTWGVDAAGNWSATNNWATNSFPNGVGVSSTFGSVITSDRIITLDATITNGSLVFDDNNNYTLSSGVNNLVLDVAAGNATILVTNANGNGSHSITVNQITLADPLTITQNSSGTLTLASVIASSGYQVSAVVNSGTVDITRSLSGGGGLVKSGAGTLLLSTNNGYSGATMINGGILKSLNSSAFASTPSVTVSNGALLITTAGAPADGLFAGTGRSATVTGSGTIWSNTSGNLYVDLGNSGNRLLVTSSGLLVNLGAAIIGFQDCTNNQLTVTGPGSQWINTGDMYLGRLRASGNILIISNGGLVQDVNGRIGENTSCTNNQVLVSGVGSVWTNTAGIYLSALGSAGAFSNSLVVNSGGKVFSSSSYIGYSGDGNFAVVGGSNSAWVMSGSTLAVGYSSRTGNQLMVTNGGRVENSIGVIGSSASGNSALVSGSGAAWTNVTSLTVGSAGSLNQLTVSNGGGVFTPTGTIGSGAAANNNTVWVDGSGSTWSVTNVLQVGSNVGASNQLTVTGGGWVSDGSGEIGAAANGNRAQVSGNGSVWTNSTTLTVGKGGSFNQMTISNGGGVFSSTGIIGFSAASSNNTVLVEGGGSKWITGQLILGRIQASGNSLIISNGALVQNTTAEIGQDPGCTNNSVVVTGAGSVWSNTGGIYLAGNYLAGAFSNSVIVSSGGKVFSSSGVIGNIGDGNFAVVGGSNSAWVMSGGLTVGNTSRTGNQLMVTNGGRVENTTGAIGAAASGNSALVSGNGSAWTNSSSLVVGNGGSLNQLAISNGGVVFSSIGTIGFDAVSSNNTVWVDGVGSTWSVTNALQVGRGSAGNQLIVTGGGQVLSSGSGTSTIGSSSSSSNSVARIAGAGSKWVNAGVTIGVLGGSDGLLVIAGGGSVLATNGNSYIGGASSPRNRAVITDVGSSWTNTGILWVGADGTRDNLLTVSNGGLLAVGSLRIGNGPTDTNNAVVVDGGTIYVTGTDQFLAVGYGGVGSSLRISNGGNVFASKFEVGSLSGASGNILDISGGSLVVTNTAKSGIVNILRGTNFLAGAGVILADNLWVTNGADSRFIWNGGTVRSGNTTVSNGMAFVVGNGSQAATFNLAGGTHRFSDGLQVSAKGTLAVTNATATIASATTTNLGTVSVMNGQAIFNGNVVNLGAWVSDPSTNTFNGNYTVGPTATVVAASGDVYALGGDFVLQSTNTAFNMSTAKAYFGSTNYGITTGTTNHTLNVAGSGAMDIGSGYTNFSQVASDFAIGTLSIGTSNRLTLTGTKSGATTNALYVGVLDIAWATTNSFAGVTNSLLLALNLPNINLYYDPYNPQNAWLFNNTPSGGYNLWGGGLLLPIPEPSTLFAIGAGLTLLAFLRRRKA